MRAAADQGVGVVLVEQHAADALDIADRIVVLRHGEVVLTGTSDELRDQLGDLESAYLTGVDLDVDVASHTHRGHEASERHWPVKCGSRRSTKAAAASW